MRRLLAIGGSVDAVTPGKVLREFYKLAGGDDARLAIITTASSDEGAGDVYHRAFVELGIRNLPVILKIHDREEANRNELVKEIHEATAVFFTGGNQIRLTSILGGTRGLSELIKAADDGMLIGGTSAGASCLSTIMIAYGRRGSAPLKGMAQFVPGLAFTNEIIFDQHFSQRNRLGRLLFAVSNHPGMLGVGIDENTAVYIAENSLKVIGQHSVMILDASGMDRTNVSEVENRKPIAMSGVRLHLLTHGCSYNMDQKIVNIPST